MAAREREILERSVQAIAEQAAKADELIEDKNDRPTRVFVKRTTELRLNRLIRADEGSVRRRTGVRIGQQIASLRSRVR